MVAPSLFFLLAVTAIAAALGMLISKNPVYSALWLILNLFCVAGLYLTLNASFLGVIQILVYAGAIMVLFLFVIMLLNLDELPRAQDFSPGKALAFIVGVLLFSQMTYILAKALEIAPTAVIGPDSAANGSVATIGIQLFTTYLLPFELIGILLLAATIGAVIIAQRKLV